MREPYPASRHKGGIAMRPARWPSFARARSTRLGALSVLLACGLLLAMVQPAASAGPPFRETIHEEFDEVDSNFCDAGLTVEDAVVLDIRVQAVAHGPDRLAYFLQHGTRTDVFTNLANGKSVTGVVNVFEKDLRVTDNGDGTLTVLVLATGNAVLYGADGKAIARDPGQLRFELLIDHGGTPTDPFDDTFLAFLGVVKGSTGRSDDFCTAVVPALS
jgi:hypothetical protein